MSRNLSTAAKLATFSQETDVAFFILLTISHPDIITPIRVVNNTENITSNGNVFLRYPFQITLPFEREDSLPTVKLVIDNIDRQIVTAVRNLSSPPTITLEVVTSNNFDVVEVGPFIFTMRSASYDSITVEGVLEFESILDQPYPAETVTPANFPGSF